MYIKLIYNIFALFVKIERSPWICIQLDYSTYSVHYGDVATTILSNSWILWSFLAMVALIPLIFTCCDSILSSSSFLLSSKSLNVSSFSSFSSPISSFSRIRDRHSSDSLDICAISSGTYLQETVVIRVSTRNVGG